jgi:hypothetical protein
MANKCIERTAVKQRLPVRFGLRPSPAAHAQRWASLSSSISAIRTPIAFRCSIINKEL